MSPTQVLLSQSTPPSGAVPIKAAAPCGSG